MPTITCNAGGACGLGCDRWKKFHFLGDLGRFSSFFGLEMTPFLPVPSSICMSACDSSDMILASKLIIDPGPVSLEMLSGRGRCSALAELFNRCIDLRKASEPFPMPSSLLSEGRRPLGAMADCRFVASRGSADGHRVVRATSWVRETSWLWLTLPESLDDGATNEMLVLLSER